MTKIKYFLIILFLLISLNVFPQGISISVTSESPDSSSILDVQSTKKGFLLPRMSTFKRDSIVNPALSLQIFNTTTNCLEIYVEGWHQIWCEDSSDYNPWLCGSTLIDSRDSNSYNTLQIGTQCWMLNNLAYLPDVHSDSEFAIAATNLEKAYGVHGYNGTVVADAKATANYDTYGVLYNWWAAMWCQTGDTLINSSNTNPSGVKGVCPDGWHLPSVLEWEQLKNYLSSNSGYWCGANSTQIAKSMASNFGWTISAIMCNVGNQQVDNNSSNFNALPGASRNDTGVFLDIGNFVNFRTSSLPYNESHLSRNVVEMRYDNALFYHDIHTNRGEGCYVRCVKD